MSPRRFVVDASVAVKWVISEPDSELAGTLMDDALFAPAFMLLECCNAIWARALRGEVPERSAYAMLRRIREAPVQLAPTESLLEDGLAMSLALRHPVYDCLYLALGVARGARLISADRRFVAKVREHRGLADQVLLLAELAH